MPVPNNHCQPPLGGCVLKQAPRINGGQLDIQPPLGGCVLKLFTRIGTRLMREPAAFRRLCVETNHFFISSGARLPAAFRRLCVETPICRKRRKAMSQPPLGGCVLKPLWARCRCWQKIQPPLGGCVLKPLPPPLPLPTQPQPPLGGCVLKPHGVIFNVPYMRPAAFRRLCVETPFGNGQAPTDGSQPPLGGCVLKPIVNRQRPGEIRQPPLGGCVLKPKMRNGDVLSTIPAAFRRLCVETFQPLFH